MQTNEYLQGPNWGRHDLELVWWGTRGASTTTQYIVQPPRADETIPQNDVSTI